MTERINKSWREQRKAVISTDSEGNVREWISVWTAASDVCSTHGCKHETAKKEIRKAIRTGVPRYGMKWQWKD